MSTNSRGIFKSPKSAAIFIGVFLVLCIVGVIVTEMDMQDWVYGEPYEMQGVVSEKEADRKISHMDTNGIAKGLSDDYRYYVHVTLENGEEVKIRCILESEYDKYTVGQQVTIVCRDIIEKGEFIGVSYDFKEEQ